MFSTILHYCGLFFLLKFYLKLQNARSFSYKCLVGKTAIITGSNTGIGYITALEFAKRGARVILACRDEEKANKAKEEIIKTTGNQNVVVRLIDLLSFKSVREFAEIINSSEDRLDILVNNAGSGAVGRKLSEDGMNKTMQGNYLSHFLLTHLLIDKLKKSAPSRIVNVASAAAMFGKLNVHNLNAYPKFSNKYLAEFLMYSNTKLCNILFTRALGEKLKNTGVNVYAVHPGFVRTDIYRNMDQLSKRIIFFLISLFFKNTEEGAQTTIHAAVSKKLDDITGILLSNCKQISFYNSASNQKLDEPVWKLSEKMVQLRDNEIL